MMNKVLYILLVFCLLFGSVMVVNGAEPSASIGNVLLIYDKPDRANTIENILTAFNQTIDKVSIDEYEAEQLDHYQYIVLLTPMPLPDVAPGTKVLCIGDGFDVPGVVTVSNNGAGIEITANNFYQYLNYIDEFSVISEFQGESFGKITMSFDREYPFGVKTGNVYYVPYLSKDNISIFALGEILPDFFGSSYQGRIHVVIEDVFAFSDLDMLCKTADELYLANIPFIVKVMPLYTNTQSDAFRRYTQVLRYVEARNGAIVMTPPIVNGEATEDEIAERMTIAVKALTEDGVTVLPSIEGFYMVDMEYLKDVKSPAKRYESFSFDVGIVENLPRSDLQLKQMVANLNGRWYEFGNYREKFGLKSKMFLETPFDEEVAARTNEKEAPLFFSVGNDVLTVCVSVMILFIVLLIYLSRVNYRRKFTSKMGR